jgi:flagellar motor protein MotB/tetratricopeptide (TPR) repeat protein
MPVKKLYIIIFIFSFFNIFSQLEKADKFYNKSQYVNAIPCYNKVVKSASASKKDKQEAYTKLGNSYRRIGDNEKAADSYSLALTFKTKNAATAEFLYNYAQVLKASGKYPEAAEQYGNYLKLNPNDVSVKNAMKFCQEIKYYLTKPLEYAVKNAPTINTKFSEFSSFAHGNQLMFSAEREEFNFSEFVVNEYDGAPYFHVYSAEIKGDEIKKEKELPMPINTDHYDGPASLSSDGKTIYFSRVDISSNAEAVNQSQIYSATLEGNKWKNIKLLNINSDKYSVAHPCISPDNNFLYFTSNMAGGFGGKDIYVSRRSGITWTKPENLGPEINTMGDEMYPTMNKAGVLYFSSNGLPGYGGLDIFSAQKTENKWTVKRNEGLSLNSNGDDFGMSFVTDSTGYFNSNRAGGKGKDDIYTYVFRSKAMTLSGTLLLTEDINNPAKKTRILLKDEMGNVVDSIITDDNGLFAFRNLNSDLKYMVILDEDDPAFTGRGKAHYYMATKDGVIMMVSGKDGTERYTFKNLPLDPNGLPDLFADDELTMTLAGNLLYDDKGASKPIKNTHLKIVNDFGDVVEQTVTNEFGGFVFRKIPGDQNYIISVDENDLTLPPGTRVFITNKSGKELKSFYTGKDKPNFRILSADKNLLQEMTVNDSELLMTFDGYMYDQDKKAVVNKKIYVREEGTDKVYDWTTTAEGRFNFKNLDADKNYIFESGDGDPTLGGLKRIYIGDHNGKIFRILDLVDGKFKFKVIESDKFAMGDFDVDDPWLQALDMKGKQGGAPLTIVESILYASGDFKADAAGQTILDKVSGVLASNPKLMIEIISHTDSRSSDSFNLALSKKRAQTAVDYIAAKGIDIKRLKAIGLGETKLLNRCANGVDCSDDEHKVNRRTEFKLTESPKM